MLQSESIFTHLSIKFNDSRLKQFQILAICFLMPTPHGLGVHFHDTDIAIFQSTTILSLGVDYEVP
ncbi:hypothetical protein PTUN_a3998 [Pseudoalteromonas tunicata]|uniref:Uncharacterized protein n=1 Tax=Pseudoalteromonas tunicata D2 TaxID=87626 RepID=A4CF54_9GAMM|nr:hypothetical protein PTUN_a3998 [Pseudoalteromonas tunicata]AXT31752.1 hypothetical protein D1819_13590 [Pseudoalteromonas tunicata]EAR26602.1 hypothetical protein PTD2_00297 [Pseudoalteromonas tunicata D2]